MPKDLRFTILPTCLLVYFTLHNSFMLGQSKTATPANEIVLRTSRAIQACTPCHYGATMQFRFFGSDSFEVRQFDVMYSMNPLNTLYGYDWAVMEMKPEDTLSVFVTSDGNYMASAQARQYVHWPLPDKTGTGDYSETMLEYFILERILHPFVDIANDQVDVIQAVDHYKLSRRTGESSSREIIIDKRTYLPIRYTASIQDTTYDLEQLQIVEFDFASTPLFPVTVEKLADHLHNAGYAYIRPEPKSEAGTESPPATMTEKQVGQLLHYPFISAKGDSTQLASIKSSYLLLDFWHASCLPCLKAMPAVNELALKYKENGLDVIGINCLDLDKREKVGAKMTAQSPAIQYYFGERPILFEIGIPHFPMYCLVHPDQSVQYIYGGINEVQTVLAALFE